MERNLKELIAQMTLDEKAGMCSGLDFWHLKGVERLGIPSVMVSDGPHGLRKQDESGDHLGINDSIKAVCFPPAALSACSFDRDLMHTFGDAIGKEAQAQDLSVVLGPAVNIKRSPLCGRNFEYYSEDPYLAGETAASFIKGVQSHHVGTSIKHFAANNQEFNRMSCSSDVDERTLREIYLPAFETAVKKAQPYTVMCSYNKINGTYASENPWLLTEVLRNDWGFEGYVMSDWGAVNDRVEGLKAGLELEMPTSGGINDREIVAAVKDGTLDEAILDQAVERILRIIFLYTDNRETQEFALEEDHKLAKKIAEESMVLLKNEDILPLSKHEKIVVIGEFAVKPRFQGGGSSHINSWKVESAVEAVKEIAEVTFARGFEDDVDEVNEELQNEAIRIAQEAEIAVIFAGLPDNFESEGYDRKHLNLPNCQNALIEKICNVQKNTIVVLHNGSPVTMPWKDRVKGIVEAYLGGQAVGKAAVNILYGNVNPSGRLAETFPLRLEDTPCYLTYGKGVDEAVYSEGVFVGYRYYTSKKQEVLFPFGYGLSYTTFTYSNLKLDKSAMTDKEVLTVSVDLENTGKRTGKEVVQIYVAPGESETARPVKELRAFDKIELAPGEKKTVVFELGARAFAYWNTEIHDWFVESGVYEIQVGKNAEDVLLSASVQVEGTKKIKKTYTLNTCMGELMQDEKAGTVFGQMMGGNQQAAQMAEANQEDPSGAVNAEMMAAMMNDMPLRQLLSFVPGMTREALEQILAAVNQ